MAMLKAWRVRAVLRSHPPEALVGLQAACGHSHAEEDFVVVEILHAVGWRRGPDERRGAARHSRDPACTGAVGESGVGGAFGVDVTVGDVGGVGDAGGVGDVVGVAGRCGRAVCVVRGACCDQWGGCHALWVLVVRPQPACSLAAPAVVGRARASPAGGEYAQSTQRWGQQSTTGCNRGW